MHYLLLYTISLFNCIFKSTTLGIISSQIKMSTLIITLTVVQSNFKLPKN